MRVNVFRGQDDGSARRARTKYWERIIEALCFQACHYLCGQPAYPEFVVDLSFFQSWNTLERYMQREEFAELSNEGPGFRDGMTRRR